MQSEIIYLLVSGGMESVYMLWKLMKESPYQIKVHHIRLTTPQKREEVEWIAFNNCIDWLRTNIKDVDVSISEYKQNFLSVYMPDYEIVTFTAACLSRLPNVIAVGQGQSRMFDEPHPKYYKFMERRTHMIELYKVALRERQPSVPHIFPILHISRQIMLDEMPRELFKLTWSCRTPIKENNKWISCGTCDVCIPFKERGIPLNEIELGAGEI